MNILHMLFVYFGGDFNAGDIDWETKLMPDDSPNMLLKEKLIEVISKTGTNQGPELTGSLLLQ